MPSYLNTSKFLIGITIFCCTINLSAQTPQDSLKDDEGDIVPSIAAYPPETRAAILGVSLYPQTLVKLERIQARTSQSFQDIISSYPRSLQENFYDLSRYPTLVSQLASSNEIKTPEQIKKLLSDFPAEVAVSVNNIYPLHINDLQTMNKSYNTSQELLKSTLQSLPDQTQKDFNKVISMPDVMNLLTDRIDLTVTLGQEYKDHPIELKQSLDSLSSEINDKNAKELDAYKKEVADNPKLQKEMKKSSKDFSSAYSNTYDGNPTTVNNYYSSDPYPYWYGYPYWYSSPIWYPQPLYYHTGFYLGPGGNMVVLGFPSYAYSNWFFGYGYRHYRGMYAQYNRYYNNRFNYGMSRNRYWGYNNSIYSHFNRGNYYRSYNMGYNRRNGLFGGRRSQNFRNSINNNGSNINHQHFKNFNSQQFHQQHWNGVRGGGVNRGGGGGRVGGYHGGGGGRRH